MTKEWARQNLDGVTSTVFVPSLLNFHLVSNTGAAFSLFARMTTLLGFLSLTVTIILLVLITTSPPLPLIKGLSYASLLGGTVGNGLDRWRLGYVTDFLELKPIDFPIFNIADIAINIALILILFSFYLNETHKKKHKSHQ